MIDALDNPATMSAPQRVRVAAEQLVSSSFIRPLLEQLRNEPLRSELFHGGLTEDIFASQLDTILADRITRVSGFGLVEAVYRRIMSGAGQGRAGHEVDRHG